MLSGSAATPTEFVRLTDDSLINPVTSFTDAGRVYNIISGSAGVLRTTATIKLMQMVGQQQADHMVGYYLMLIY